MHLFLRTAPFGAVFLSVAIGNPYFRTMEASWDLFLMALIYILAGVFHFVYPKMYERIIPPWIPGKKSVVFLSGILEIVLGFALVLPELRTLALYGIIILLILFLPVHTYMLSNERASMGMPRWVLILRIPLQGLLIYWAYLYL